MLHALTLIKITVTHFMGTGTFLTIRDGHHTKHRQNGRVVFYATWGAFILYNATSPF